MGDSTAAFMSASNSAASSAGATPGIMLVRPSLHSQTDSNSATFKRWTVMHFNDMLYCSPLPGAKGITQALRYTSTDGQLLYTIHADDISVWQTPAYHAVSRRLDLENTREVAEGESKVLEGEQGLGDEPMVWNLVDAAFGIFEEYAVSPPDGKEEAYHALPVSLLSGRGERPETPGCMLVTLTYTSPSSTLGRSERGDGIAPPKQLIRLRDQTLKVLSEDLDRGGKVYTSIYRHRPDAQPEMHPPIAEGIDGNGAWVVCVLVEGDVSDGVRTQLQNSLDNSVQEAVRKEGLGGSKLESGVKVGVWKGEVFMR